MTEESDDGEGSFRTHEFTNIVTTLVTLNAKLKVLVTGYFF